MLNNLLLLSSKLISMAQTAVFEPIIPISRIVKKINKTNQGQRSASFTHIWELKFSFVVQ